MVCIVLIEKPCIFRSIKLKRSRTCRFIKFNSVYTNYRVQGATLSGARTYYGVIKFLGGQFSRIVRFSYLCRVVYFELAVNTNFPFGKFKICNMTRTPCMDIILWIYLKLFHQFILSCIY